MDIRRLENIVMDAMLLCREQTVKCFGKAIRLPDKSAEEVGAGHLNEANQIVTPIDLLNQEIILKQVYQYYPGLEISVEERTNDPTDTQAAFYKNDGRSEYLFQLDPIDGTKGYAEGITNKYGIIGSLLKRVSDTEGIFVSAMVYYPSLDMFLLANEYGIHKMDKNWKFRLLKANCLKTSARDMYSAIFTHDKKRLGLKTEETVHAQDMYAATQEILDLVHGNIPGFMNTNSHLCDHITVDWMAKIWGADVAYANGKEFYSFPWGDSVTAQGRMTQRDSNGLVVVGDKNDRYFTEYLKNYKADQE